MKNGLKIEWTANAQSELKQTIDYLETNWTSKEIKQLLSQLGEVLLIIEKFPFIYPATKKKENIRRCVISKQACLYYQIESNHIIILSFFDNRQNPNKLKI